MFLGSTFILLALLNFEFSPFYQAIFRPYPVIAYAAICLWFAHGVKLLATVLLNATNESLLSEKLLEHLSEHQIRSLVFLIAGVAAVFSVYSSNYQRVDRSGSQLIDTYARTVLSTLPNDAVLFTYGDNQSGPIGYLSLVEELRPDVEVRDWANLVFSNRLSSPFMSQRPNNRRLKNLLTQQKGRFFPLRLGCHLQLI